MKPGREMADGDQVIGSRVITCAPGERAAVDFRRELVRLKGVQTGHVAYENLDWERFTIGAGPELQAVPRGDGEGFDFPKRPILHGGEHLEVCVRNKSGEPLRFALAAIVAPVLEPITVHVDCGVSRETIASHVAQVRAAGAREILLAFKFRSGEEVMPDQELSLHWTAPPVRCTARTLKFPPEVARAFMLARLTRVSDKQIDAMLVAANEVPCETFGPTAIDAGLFDTRLRPGDAVMMGFRNVGPRRLEMVGQWVTELDPGEFR